MIEISPVRRQVEGFTVDNEGSRDLDDALWAEECNNGIRLYVHIADVATTIYQGSRLDLRGFNQIETRYFNSGTIPMLPRSYSEGELSLLPGQLRKTITVAMEFSSDGMLCKTELFPSTLISMARLSYSEVDNVPSDHICASTWKLCKRCADVLGTRRLDRGALSGIRIDDMTIDEDGNPVQCHFNSQRVIMEFAIAANMVIADEFSNRGVPALYRNHAPKPLSPHRKSIAESMQKAGSVEALRSLLSSYLDKARYDVRSTGHFALDLPSYCHFTSPIRRYADLINHRIVHALIQGKRVPYSDAELALICSRINAHRVEVKKERNEYFKNKATSQMMEKACNDDHFESMGNREFSRFIRLLSKEGALEPIAPEIFRRLESSRLTPNDICHLIFFGNDSSIKAACIAFMEEYREFATMTLSTAQQLQYWERSNFICEEKLPKFPTWFIADGQTSEQPGTGRGKDMAKHSASLRYIKAFVESSLVEEERKALPLPPPSLEKETRNVLLVDENHIGYLLEQAQLNKCKHPHFRFTKDEKGFVCECHYTSKEGVVIGNGSGPRKQVAKQDAAKDVCKKLMSQDNAAS